jgi:hypothetical protein
MGKFIQKLIDEERNAVISTMAFMSYNPSIGRVLEKDGVKVFQELAFDLVKRLPKVNTISSFDSLHDTYVKKLISKLKRNKKYKEKDVSYGQAQKPLNVFLKVFVDWAGKPNKDTRKKILSFLHVPLDSIVMKTMKKEYPDLYKSKIKRYVKKPQQAFSLSLIDKNIYLKWQSLFRSKHPKKPLIYDVIWAINR